MANKNIRSLAARKELNNNLFEQISELSLKNAAEKEFHELAKSFFIDDSVVYGTASFYDFLKPENRNKKIHICNGTACLVAGSQESLHRQLEKHFKVDEIGHAACVGRCHENSAFMLDDKVYSADSSEKIKEILNHKSIQENQYHIGCNTTPILTKPVADITAFYQLIKTYKNNPTAVIDALKTANLRGRGGAGFPFYFKVDAVSKEPFDSAQGVQKYVVCNADEGDPGAYSDMYLLEHQTHKVLFGMMMTGIIVGANTGVLYIRAEYPDAIRKTQNAIQELTDLNLLNGFKFKIIRGQGAYVCGEETALLNSIEGLRPEVRVRPPFPTQSGLFGKPTLLSNVETFANVHWILENGGKAYANIGTSKSAGTKLVSLDSYFNQPGIYEIEMGTPIATIFNDYGKGLKTDIKAWQIGGPLGGIVPNEKIKDLTLDFESLNENGFLLGHASFVSIPQTFPMIAFMEYLLKFTADESCGKCYPCRIGSYRGYELVKKAQESSYQIDRKLMDDLLETLEIGSLCALGGGIPLPLKNALQYFSEELTPYFKN